MGLEDSEGDEEAWAGVASLPLGLDITIVLTQLQGMTHAAASLIPILLVPCMLSAAPFGTTHSHRVTWSTAINPNTDSFRMCPIF